MTELVLTTLDWVPEAPRGFVRDLRVRWALEEAGVPYRVEGVSFDREERARVSRQPFNQVPWLTDGEVTIFESGAILLYLGDRSDALMPGDPGARAVVTSWVLAALNSVEMASLPWSMLKSSDDGSASPGGQQLQSFLHGRLAHLERALKQCEWLVDRFSVADILMADVLRLVDRFGGLADRPTCRDYLARGTARPAFQKAHADQLAYFAAADERRNATG